MDNRSILTPQEVADILKIAKNTVYELIKRGELSAYKVGKKIRIEAGEIEAYKSRSKVVNPQATSASTPAPVTAALPETPEIPARSRSIGFVICGQDGLLDILSRHLEAHPNGVQALRS